MKFTKTIILASQSPRRSQLLREAGFDFVVRAKDVEESYPADLPVLEIAPFLAQKKARASSELLDNQSIILAADSIVILDEVVYGKPQDREDGIRMLRALSGKKHQVVTGVCLLSPNKEVVFSEIANVYMENLTDEEILHYLDTYKPYDKAGAYAIQEWIGHCKISRIEGTYSNIMGLPVQLVYQYLQNFI